MSLKSMKNNIRIRKEGELNYDLNMTTGDLFRRHNLTGTGGVISENADYHFSEKSLFHQRTIKNS